MRSGIVLFFLTEDIKNQKQTTKGLYSMSQPDTIRSHIKIMRTRKFLSPESSKKTFQPVASIIRVDPAAMILPQHLVVIQKKRNPLFSKSLLVFTSLTVLLSKQIKSYFTIRCFTGKYSNGPSPRARVMPRISESTQNVIWDKTMTHGKSNASSWLFSSKIQR